MGNRWLNVAGSLFSLYFFVASIMLIKSSATQIAEQITESIVLVIRDTTSGVFAGWIGTALLHSSGGFDSIVVAFVSSGVMPLGLAVSTVVGAEVGTTVTPFLISVLNQVRKKDNQSAVFNVTITHVLYNLCTLMLFYPAELFFGFLTSIALQGSNLFMGTSIISSSPDFLAFSTPWIPLLLKYIPPWAGVVIGAIVLVLALSSMERYMSGIFNMPRSWNLIRATFQHPVRSFFAGLLFTILIPSTTVMVSLLVPLATSGVLGVNHFVLPYILGANIGTTLAVMLAAMATGDPVAMGVWFVQFTINVTGAVLFMILLKPFSRVTKFAAERVAASPRMTLVVAAVFHVFPAAVVLFYALS